MKKPMSALRLADPAASMKNQLISRRMARMPYAIRGLVRTPAVAGMTEGMRPPMIDGATSPRELIGVELAEFVLVI